MALSMPSHRESYLGRAVKPPVALWVRVTLSSSWSLSFAAVTVTVCAVLQSDVVKVRVEGSAVTSVPAVPPTVTVTVPVGSPVSTKE